MSGSPLFPNRRAKAHARVRLVCLPYSGGAARIYREWPAKLGGDASDVEVCAVELPGRGRRFRDEPWTTAEQASREIAAGLAQLPPLPTVLFGQSLGARLAFKLVKHAGVRAVAIIAAAAASPHVIRRQGIADLPRDELVRELSEFGGMAPEALENEELMSLIIPLVRADLRIAEWRASPDDRVDCPITVLWGRSDPSVSREEAANWTTHSSAPVEVIEMEGGHFFVADHLDEVIAHVRKVIDAR